MRVKLAAASTLGLGSVVGAAVAASLAVVGVIMFFYYDKQWEGSVLCYFSLALGALGLVMVWGRAVESSNETGQGVGVAAPSMWIAVPLGSIGVGCGGAGLLLGFGLVGSEASGVLSLESRLENAMIWLLCGAAVASLAVAISAAAKDAADDLLPKVGSIAGAAAGVPIIVGMVLGLHHGGNTLTLLNGLLWLYVGLAVALLMAALVAALCQDVSAPLFWLAWVVGAAFGSIGFGVAFFGDFRQADGWIWLLSGSVVASMALYVAEWAPELLPEDEPLRWTWRAGATGALLVAAIIPLAIGLLLAFANDRQPDAEPWLVADLVGLLALTTLSAVGRRHVFQDRF